ncbi:lactate permease [Mannheimia granulomatis]|uniref:L-lactate permease n=1 Tax=Mannheimia granulomatis TaxID=85402 RepID=A0A6G8JH17_9PAST|nr:L-lactate permease [Mannheimia granulomatis]QIM66437.1 lactate permease [Mannheimia granulomatis]
MDIPVNFFMWFMALLPIITLVILMVKFQWGATEAAPVGLLITIFSGIFLYQADVSLIAIESAKGIWNAFVILLIVWTAVLMYQVSDAAKAFLVIRTGMSKLFPNELLLVMTMGWIFESFLQGITGFGVPVAVGAPLLIGIGVRPLWAVVLPLLGQAWGNTFGTLAAAWDALAVSAGLEVGSDDYFLTALWSAAFLWFWIVVTGLAISWFYGRGKALKKGLLATVIIATIQGGGELVLSQVNTTISAFIPACLSILAIVVISKMSMYKDNWRVEDSPIMDRTKTTESTEKLPNMNLLQAFIPYIVLSVMTFAILVITPVNQFLSQFKFGFAFPETITGYGFVNKAYTSYSPIAIFTHASMFLFVSSIIGLLYYKHKGWIGKGGTQAVFAKSISMTMPSGIAVVGLVIMSKIMGGTGQTAVLAQGMAAVLGKSYVILSPFIGFLGTFMTGSNMSSNILFGDFQMTTSKLLNANSAAILGAQTTGGAIGSAISPSKIILGTTTANILGKEGDVMKAIIWITLLPTLFIGIVAYFASL